MADVAVFSESRSHVLETALHSLQQRLFNYQEEDRRHRLSSDALVVALSANWRLIPSWKARSWRWRSFCRWCFSGHTACVKATSQLVTGSSRHTVMSSHGQLVTGQLVTHMSHHTVKSSQASTLQNHQYQS